MFSPHRRILFREILLVFGWLFVALLLITLLTYSPEDPAWSWARGDDAERDIQNRFGATGAYIADILLSALGYSSYLLCLIIFIVLHAVLRPAVHISAERLGGWWCALGLLLFMLSSGALENIRFSGYAAALPSAAGGGIGELVAGGMQELFGYTGAAMILLCIWIVGWSLAANLSWFSFCEMIGRWIENAVLSLGAYLERRRDLRRGKIAGQKREAAMADARKPVAHVLTPPAAPAKKPPQIVPPPPPKLVPPPVKLVTAAAKSSATASLPSAALLDVYEETASGASAESLARNCELIEQTLKSFGIKVSVLATYPGPVITRYEIRPDAGVKGAQIVSLVRDMARALSVSGIRVLETIPGKDCMGLEIPNPDRATVYFSDVIADDSYTHGENALPLALGKDATGKPLVVDLAKMPHVLVAGATGSGKSVCINVMLLSLLFASPPEKLRLILIDPKMLELASYHDIPHLLAPVVTDVSLAPAALNWAVEEMENRYRLMSGTGARNIDSYNKKIAGAPSTPENPAPLPLPYIVVMIDELADLMMTTGKKVEMTISRLAQKARAAGIHLILATQRPSVDVITGLIKANVPCRIAFQVASKVDSRTIIDQMGAEILLGMGDMLYLPAGAPTPLRVHGAFVGDDEVRRIADHLRAGGGAKYEIDFSHPPPSANFGNADAESDEMYDHAVEAVLSSNRPSISLVQRKLRIGYNRAARLIEAMESAGIVSSADDTGVRKILAPRSSSSSE